LSPAAPRQPAHHQEEARAQGCHHASATLHPAVPSHILICFALLVTCCACHLQHHASLRTIKKKLVRKALDAIKKMADDEVACNDDSNDGELHSSLTAQALAVSHRLSRDNMLQMLTQRSPLAKPANHA
jgi:hypothetical protein